MFEHWRALVDGAVPPLVSELTLTLVDSESSSVLDARQQKRFLPTQLPLPVAQRKVGTAQLLRAAGRRHAQPPDQRKD